MKFITALLTGIIAIACGYRGIEYKENTDQENYLSVNLEKENR